MVWVSVGDRGGAVEIAIAIIFFILFFISLSLFHKGANK